RRRPAQQDYAGAFLGLELDEELTAGLKALGQRHGTTLFMTVLAGWALVLSRLSGQEDVVIGTSSANRTRAEVEGLIGFFVNMLALRLDLSGSPSAEELLARAKAVALGAQAHQELPFEQVVELVKPARSLAYTPVFQVTFAWQNFEKGRFDLPGLAVETVQWTPTTSKFDLTLTLGESGGRIAGGIEYATALFDRETVERFGGYLRRALEEMVADAARPAAALPLLPADERHRLLVEWNRTAAAYPAERCVHELFEEQVARDPQATAVVHGTQSLSYGELNARANRLAHRLRTLGVKPDDRVAICVERSSEMIVGLLGILKAGGAYVPLDPAYPAERLAFMLQDGAPVAALTHGPARAVLDAAMAGLETPPPVLDLEEDEAAPDADLRVPGLTSRNLAYVIYTSGSTGMPKGVMVEHHSTVNLVMGQRDALGVGPQSRILQFASLSFDAALFEILLAFGSGGALYLRPQGELLAGAALPEFLRTRRISHAVLTPSALTAVPVQGAASAEPTTLVLAGEALPKALVERWAPEYPLFNSYGPTEATVWATLHRCDVAAAVAPPIGRPVANTRLYLLDGRMEPVPAGVAGEIWIGGAGVARGYLNRPELTSQRFVASPFVAGDRLYKTGDLGRWLPDGTAEFLGRNDFQVKVRGFRIELGEIEARLLEHPGVREAVVLAREDQPGDRRLVAYVTGEADQASLRRHLASSLPEHMVPAAYVRLDALPLTPNGKLDRRALPAPEGEAFAFQAYEPPAGPAEEALAAIWAEVLGLERIGRHDNFFDLGGHSLLAVRMVSRIRQVLGVEVALTALFGHPLLQNFARVLAESGREVLPPVALGARGDRPPLSFAQQRLWFLARMGGGASEAYHVPLGFRMRGLLDEAALKKALDRLVARHEALRTTFSVLDGEPFLRIGDPGQGFELRRDDLSGRADPQAGLDAATAAEAALPFDLERGPLVRGRLVRLADEDHVLLVTLHHIAADGWSMGVLARELSVLYRAYAQGGEDPLEPLAVQYADYAAWQRRWLSGEVLTRQSAYWRETLSDAPALLELPTDRRRPAQQDYAGAFVGLELDEELTAGLKALGQRHGTTLFMTVLAGWALVLARLSGQDDVVIGTSSANRTRAEVEGLIGFFVNMLALRLDLSGSPSAEELLARAKAVMLGAQAHQELPFEQVVELVKPARSLAYTPVFQATFAWQNFEKGRFDLPGLAVETMRRAPTTSKFDLTLSLGEAGGRIVGGIEYATALFDRGTVERFGGYLRRVLEEMVADAARLAAALPLLSQEERHRLLVEWNDTAAAYPQERCVHELFEEQVARDPQATAIVHGTQSLTYGELNARANRLARHLRTLGVGPDRLAAVCIERSPEMVVALVAVLKAGGAYLPLDPAYPADRLAYILGDAAPAVVLTHAPARPAADAAVAGLASRPAVLDLDGNAGVWAGAGDADLGVRETGVTPRHLAYVLYTSGSTGAPKGVMVEHGALVNHTAWFNREFGIDRDDVVLQRTPFTFDASVWEIFSTLAGGARLRLARGAELGDVD
ncbi:non-ribosomal peptide synthetase, partial [Arenibaculum sp.]|uniref:non-ribosomal peptide synthetase n=1 Tax=Arenibaculum sp. TaxID=2865862 RepID=UPI002E0E7BF8